MEMTTGFPLLLIASLCTAQLQTETDNEITPLGKQTEPERRDPTIAADQQQRCAPDIHTVLREMSALLGEQRVEMRHLQRENEAQAAQLREQKTEIDQLNQQLKATLKEQKTEMETLGQQLQAQTVELITIKAKTNVTEIQVEALNKDREVKQVAFSASLLASGFGDTGPFNTQTPLVFQNIITNIGNAYNPNTGFFTAPVRGAYHFEFYIYGRGHASRTSGAVLVKNGHPVCIAYEHQLSGVLKSSNGATLPLEVGDIVFLRLWQNSWVNDNGNHHTTFSGHLLFTM